MMEPFERIEIQELPLRVPSVRRKVEDFLGRNGLRLEEVDLYLAVLDEDGDILAGGGLQRDIIKCIAVSEAARSAGLSVPLISRLISEAAQRGFTNVKVFTKPENRSVFESLGFKVLAQAPKAILMENGRGLEDYCRYLREFHAVGVIVMNANPFTLGHRYLVEQAASVISGDSPRRRPRKLVIIPVKEDRSRFPYIARLEMIRQGCGDFADVVEGSDYQISVATFPTYFLKDLSDAAETQMRLDIDLFGRHIAPALGATTRFVGSEPMDPLTARYNELMKELLPSFGVRVVEIPRLAFGSSTGSGAERVSVDERVEPLKQEPVSASRVREALDQGRFRVAATMTPASTWPYLLAELAGWALAMELDTPMKPGLVGPDSKGAHTDMDHALMRKGIEAIRPFFPRMAMADSPSEVRQLGIDAERAMMAATGGVNTHRGAIFALGLALNAAGDGLVRQAHQPDLKPASRPDGLPDERRMESPESERVMRNRVSRLAHSILNNSLIDRELHSTASSHGSRVVKAHGAKGAMQMALEGYRELFDSWLPYYRSVKADAYGLQRTLLKIMSELDDTCIIHRVGYARAQQVKAEAEALLRGIGPFAQAQGPDRRMENTDNEKLTQNCVPQSDHSFFDNSLSVSELHSTAFVKALSELCERYAEEGISPGGAADMLALTLFVDSILH